jgi:hypothetical protein
VTARIVEAIATFAGAGRLGRGISAREIEAAMAAAACEAAAAGITDPDKVRALMLAAREKVKAGR